MALFNPYAIKTVMLNYKYYSEYLMFPPTTNYQYTYIDLFLSIVK